MLTAIVTVLFSFILTGLVGNFLIYGWQRRNWIEQQRLLRSERELTALQELFDEVTSLAGRRHHRMFRLLVCLPGKDVDLIKKRLGEYDEVTGAWNERLNALFAKITMLIEWRYTKELESIQENFVSIGRDLERMTSESLAEKEIHPKKIKSVSQSLDRLQGKTSAFHKHVLRFMDERKTSIYSDVEVEVTEHNLDRLPTWELFKALFKPRIQRNNVV